MMTFLYFLLGFTVGFIGVIPPGLLNLTAAKISIKQSRKAGIIFAVGASLVVIIQVYAGVFFSKLLNDHQKILVMLENFAIGAFIALSIFFFIKARLDSSPELKPVDKSSIKLFGQGIILSAINFFPIPFYMGFSSFLAQRDLFTFEYPMAHLFITGACIGTFAMLWMYVNYVKKFGFDSRTFARKINYILSLLTLSIALFTLVRIYEIF